MCCGSSCWQDEKVEPSYDLIQATKKNTLLARCSLDAVCAALAGWAYDSTDNPTGKHLQDLHAHVSKGQPAAVGTGQQTTKMTDLKLYGHHQYAVMGIKPARDGEPCFDVRNPHNKMMKKHAMLPPARGKSLKNVQLYNGKATAEFLLQVKDADMLNSTGSSVIYLTMP